MNESFPRYNWGLGD